MARMRWFLREGWGRFPWNQTGEAHMEETEATVLLPSFGGSGLDLQLTLSAPGELLLGVAVNGRPLERLVVTPDPQAHAVRIPADLLFRGDNVLTLTRESGGGRPASSPPRDPAGRELTTGNAPPGRYCGSSNDRGGPKKYPWARVNPMSTHASASSAVSTPSATGSAPRSFTISTSERSSRRFERGAASTPRMKRMSNFRRSGAPLQAR